MSRRPDVGAVFANPICQIVSFKKRKEIASLVLDHRTEPSLVTRRGRRRNYLLCDSTVLEIVSSFFNEASNGDWWSAGCFICV